MRRLVLIVVVVIVVAGVGVGAFVLGRASPGNPTELHTSRKALGSGSGVSTTTTQLPSTTTTLPATTTTATIEGRTLPLVTDCNSSPEFKPSALHWCQSFCSSSMEGINWRNWGTSSATGVGTWVTRNTPRTATIPCIDHNTVFHAGTPVVLTNPALMKICVGGQTESLWVFTKVTPPTVATVREELTPPC